MEEKIDGWLDGDNECLYGRTEFKTIIISRYGSDK